MIRVLIADDHPIIRAGIRKILSDTLDIKVTDEASNGQEVISRVSKSDYDVIILDISMPGIGGLEALKHLRRLKPKLPILILSQHKEEEYAIRAIRAGASGYVRKISAPEELITAIRKLYRGGKYITPSLAEELASALPVETAKPLHQALSDREFQVICLIAKGRTIREIAEELALSSSTVATYRNRVLSKMNMKTNNDLTYYAINNRLLN